MIPSARLLPCLALLAAAPSVAGQAPRDLYDEAVVRRVDLVFAQPNYWSQLQANYSGKRYIKADLKIDGVTYKDVGVRFRGNTSYWALPNPNSQKVPFKVKLDEYVPDQKVQKYSTLNFNNNYMDPSWARETVTYSVFREFFPAPKCNYVHLYINGQSWGPYFNTQQINKAMLAEWFESDEGNRYRAEIDAWLTWTGTQCSGSILLKTSPSPNPWTDLHGMCRVLNTTPAAQLYDELPKVLDVDKTLWMHACATSLIWLDSYLGFRCWNFYICSDIANGRMVPMPWDTNNAFGTFRVGQPVAETISPFFRETDAQRPLFSKLVSNPRWRQRYLAHIRTIVDTKLDWKNLAPIVDRFQKTVEPLVKTDPKAMYTYQEFLDNRNKAVPVPVSWDAQATAPGFQPFANARTAYLRSHPEVNRPAPSVTDLRIAPAQPTVADDVWVTAKVTGTAPIGGVKLFYRHHGPYIEVPMFDDGNHRDGAANDGVYGERIPRQTKAVRVEYYVGAETAAAQGGAMAFAPQTASTRAPSFQVRYRSASLPLVINEVMAVNTATIQDPNGEYDDWLELHNTSSAAVAVGGMYLTDDFADPTKWQIPGAITVPAGGRLLFWCDGQPGQGALHTSFKLGAGGEWVGLFDATGQALVDSVELGPQRADVSAGRFTDGSALWVSHLAPTPSLPNTLACGARGYDARDPFLHRFALALAGLPRIGTAPTLGLADGPKSGSVVLFLGTAPGHLPLGADLVLMLGGTLVGPAVVPTDANGAFQLQMPIPNNPAIVGASVYLQAGGSDAAGSTASNGLQVVICR